MQQLPLPSLSLAANPPVIPDPPSSASETITLEFVANLPTSVFLRPTSFTRLDTTAALGTALKPAWTHVGGSTITGFTVTTTDNGVVDIFWGDSATPTIAASGVAKNHTYA